VKDAAAPPAIVLKRRASLLGDGLDLLVAEEHGRKVLRGGRTTVSMSHTLERERRRTFRARLRALTKRANAPATSGVEWPRPADLMRAASAFSTKLAGSSAGLGKYALVASWMSLARLKGERQGQRQTCMSQ
jgi:hypothetical protein